VGDVVTRRVAVTGSTGFIGRHLVTHLAARGLDVVPVGRPLDRAALTQAFRGADAVVHLAGVVSALRDRDFVAVNVEGTRAVTEAARDAGVRRLVHISSLAAAGAGSARAPRTEDDPSAPVTPYGRSKLESERVVAAATWAQWLVLRPGVVYGPGDRAMLPLFRMAARGVLPLVGHPAAAYTLIYVVDLLRVLDAAIDSTLGGETLFVGHPRPVTARELLEGIRCAVGRRAPIVRVPMAVTRLAAIAGDMVGTLRGRPQPINRSRYIELAAEGFVCSVDRLRDRLGIVAQVDLAHGLADTARWYENEGWL
jgi:dihydroflavonol-4-reductase